MLSFAPIQRLFSLISRAILRVHLQAQMNGYDFVFKEETKVTCLFTVTIPELIPGPLRIFLKSTENSREAFEKKVSA